MRKSILLFTFLFIFFFFPGRVFAESSYVLPYPSAMPGSAFYKLNQVEEMIMKYWYFGDFGQFNYNLKLADKYLVEGKILMEYKQYLLGYKALEKSNSYFLNTRKHLLNAERNGKDISEKVGLLREASKKHREVLSLVKESSPSEFMWSPEKAPQQELGIEKLINKSIELRENYEKISF